MIIRCPDCTTGFKLPNDQVSEDPIKVRCSKCSHIFKVGLVDDEPILYDEDGERLPDEDQKTRVETEADKKADAGQTQEGTGFAGDSEADEASDEADESDIALDESDEIEATDTHIGTGAAAREEEEEEDEASAEESSPREPGDDSASDSGESSSDYNPFPHANSDIGPKKSKAITGEGDEEQDAPSQSGTGAAAANQPVPEEQVEAERAKVDDEAFRETQQIDPEEKFGDEAAAQPGGGTVEQQAPAAAANGPDLGGEAAADGGQAEATAQSTGQQAQQQNQQQQAQQRQAEPQQGAQDQQAQQGQQAQQAQAQQAQAEQPAAQQQQPQQPEPQPAQQPSSQGQQTAQPEQPPSQQEPELQTGPQQMGSQQEGDYWDKEPADDEYHDEYFDPETGTRQKKAESGEATVSSSPGGGPAAGGGQPNTGQTETGTSNRPQAASGGQPTGGQTTGGQPTGGPQSQSNGAGPSSPGGPGSTGGPGPQVQSSPSTGPGGASTGQSAKPKTSAGSAGAEPASVQSSSWAVDDVDRVDPQQFGSSGFQTFANFVLIVLIVGAGFLTFVSAQNAWLLDFKKFRQMLQVAFQNGEYEPREAWTSSDQPVRPAPPKDPIEFRNVFAQVLTLGGEEADEDAPRVLVLRGEVKNISETAFPEAKVRGLIKDAQGKVIEQQVAPVGAHVASADLTSLDSTDAIGEKLPDTPSELAGDDTQPFTIVFSSVPADVTSGKTVKYAVEFEPEKDLPPGSSGD